MCMIQLMPLCTGSGVLPAMCGLCATFGPSCAAAQRAYVLGVCAPPGQECADIQCAAGDSCCGYDVGGGGVCAQNCSASAPAACGGATCGSAMQCCRDDAFGAYCSISCEPSYVYISPPPAQLLVPAQALISPASFQSTWAPLDCGAPPAGGAPASSWRLSLGSSLLVERSGYSGVFQRGYGVARQAGTMLLLTAVGRSVADVEVACQVTRTAGNAGLAFRVTTVKQYYAVTIGAHGTTLLRRSPGPADGETLVLAQGADAVADGVMISRLLRVVMVGQRIWVYVDGRLVISATDIGAIGAGQLGLYSAASGNASFANVFVRDLSRVLTIGGASSLAREDVAVRVALVRMYSTALALPDVVRRWQNGTARFAAPLVSSSGYDVNAAAAMTAVASALGLFTSAVSTSGTIEAITVQFPPGYTIENGKAQP